MGRERSRVLVKSTSPKLCSIPTVAVVVLALVDVVDTVVVTSVG